MNTNPARCAPHNQALLAFIRQHQPVCTWDAFSLFEGAGANVKTFSTRLVYLSRTGWLRNIGSTYRGIWELTEKAVDLLDHGPCPTTAPGVPVGEDADDDEPGPIVPPRRVDVMHGPLYRPPAMSYRDGAMDHAACPSITAGRAVPFLAAGDDHHDD